MESPVPSSSETVQGGGDCVRTGTPASFAAVATSLPSTCIMDSDALDAFAVAYGADPTAYRSEVHRTLQLAGLYLLGYELVEQAVVERTKDFFIEDPSPEYQKLLDRVPRGQGNRPFRAGLLFLTECGGLTADESDELVQLLNHRNDIGHRLPQIVFDAVRPQSATLKLDLGKLHKVPMYLYKLSNSWANVVMDTHDVEYDDEARQGATTPAALIFGAIFYQLTGNMPDAPTTWCPAITRFQDPEV